MTKRAPLISCLIVATLTAVLTAASVQHALVRYHAVRSGWSWDLAYYNQWYWSLLYGDQRISVRPIAAYGDEGPSVWKTNYLSPLRFLLIPIYAIGPGPRLLLVVHSVFFWWLIPAAYTLMKSESRSNLEALAASALVPLTPLLWPLAENDFREIQMALPFVLWGVQGVRSRNMPLAAFGIGMMLACRQEMAVIVATLALVPARESEDIGRTYRWAHTLVVVGVAWLVLGFFGYLRFTNGPASPAEYLSQFGGPKAPLGETCRTALTFLLMGLGGWVITMALAPRLALLMVPWVWSLSSGKWSMRFVGTERWHEVRYTAPFVTLGLAAGLIGFARLARWLQARPRGRWLLGLAWLVIAWASIGSLFWLHGLTEQRPHPIDAAEVEAFWAAARRVAPEDGVLAHYDFTAPLSSRRLLASYVLEQNKPAHYPELGPEFRWIFYRTQDGTTEVFENQGFRTIHSGSYLTILEREGSAGSSDLEENLALREHSGTLGCLFP